MKKCPYCAEEIQDEAIVCRYCGRDLTTPPPIHTPPAEPQATGTQATSAQAKPPNRALLVIVVLVLLCVLVFGVFQAVNQATKSAPTPSLTPEDYAWWGCISFIQTQLGLDPLDAQQYNPAGVTPLGSGEFRVRIFYAKETALYQCDLVQQPDGNTRLLRLSLVP